MWPFAYRLLLSLMLSGFSYQMKSILACMLERGAASGMLAAARDILVT
jgi:hypothetical protein